VLDPFFLALVEFAFGIAIFGHFRACVAVTLIERALVFALLFRLVRHPAYHGRHRRQRRFIDALGEERQRQQNRADGSSTNGFHDQAGN
jgi:hypothetical protein